MSEPIRVLHVIRLMNHGGVESMIMNLYRNIDRTKVQFDFVQNSNEPAVYDEEILSLGGKIYHCPHYNGKNHFTYTKWWHNFFKTHPGEYPIVHGHLGSTAAIYLSIAKKHGSYAIAHSHSTGGSLSYQIFAYPTRFIADHFFACSKDAGVSRYGKKVGNDKIRCTVLKNAIDASRFAYNGDVRKKMRTSLGITDEMLVVGHVGQFREQKNHAFLLDIFRKVHETNPNSILLLVGDGDLRLQIESGIAEKGLQGSVILTGSRNDVWNYYQAMDVFVMPSHYEGLPVSMVEAQTAGLPCVVSKNVPEESAITDLVRFIPLEYGANHWCVQVMEHAHTTRQEMLEQIKAVGFDIKSTALWLTDYYTETVKKHG